MRLVLIAVALLLLSGCSTPVPLRIAGGEIRTLLSGEAPLASVRCSRATWSRVEQVKLSGLPFQLETGEVFAAAFTGTKPDLPALDVISSHFESKIENLGFTGSYSYTATVQLPIGGEIKTFTASHTLRTSAIKSLAYYIKIPVETVVADLLAQVKRAVVQKSESQIDSKPSN